ncbi:MAG: hypothetical protein OEW12_08680 [Deltaproteobacteria bacterium]|nr:hypothetical protein [Deltaproteobacteria bacterium]
MSSTSIHTPLMASLGRTPPFILGIVPPLMVWVGSWVVEPVVVQWGGW